MPQDFNQNNKEKNTNFQDVIPPKTRRSVRDIPIPEGRRKRHLEPEPVVSTHEEQETLFHDEGEESDEQEFETPRFANRAELHEYANIKDGHFSQMKTRNYSYIIKIIIALLVIVGIIFAFFKTAGDAHLNISPRQEKNSVDATFSAKKAPLDNELGFEIITLSKESSEVAEASGEEEVSRKASGMVVIYNNFSTSEQKLIANTRLQTASGLIYRITDPIVVPGQQTVNGKLLPGSVEVKVWADEAGEKYNTASADFTIPGFKGDPRFDKFYAKSKGPIKDGFVGKEKKVDPVVLHQTKSKLQTKLEEELLREIRAQVPPKFLIYEQGVVTFFESLPSVSTSEKTVEIKEKGTVSAIAFDREKLSMVVAQHKDKIEGTSFVGVENLTFELLSREAFNPLTSAEISFTLKGEGSLVWGYDKQQLAQDLRGIDKKDLRIVLAKYPTIEKAEAILKPFWTYSFPKTVEKITIKDILENN